MARKSADAEPITSLIQTAGRGIVGCCPACGQGGLFSDFLALRNECGVCGCNFGFADAGDGPAIFVMLITGFLIVGAALSVEVFYQPPYWLHAVLWLPLGIVLPLATLRPLKGLLVALQFRHEAAEGRLAD